MRLCTVAIGLFNHLSETKFFMPDKNAISEIVVEKLALTLSAAMFLSRLPLNILMVWLTGDTKPRSEQFSFEKSAQFFGPAAIIVALPAAIIFSISSLLELPAIIAVILTLITLIVTTGALHEDALADVADGFGGGKTREKKLEIMRDSQIGTFGGCALILSIALQIACLVELSRALPNSSFILVLIAANVASTAIMAWPWANEPPARSDGGLSTNLGMPTNNTAIIAVTIGFSISSILLWIAVGLYATAISLVVCWICMMAFTRLARNQIGGHTGDSLGATKKLSELGLLLALIVAT